MPSWEIVCLLVCKKWTDALIMYKTGKPPKEVPND